MKYSRKFSIQFYLVVGAVLGCLGGGLVWKVTHVVLQETSFNLYRELEKQFPAYWPLLLVLSFVLLALYFVLLPVLCLLGATLFGFLGYRLGKHLHEKDSDRRMSLSDEERRAFEKELKQAEAEGKEVWTRK